MGQGIGEIMYFSSLADLWYMSGHGFYVWMAYGISLLVLIFLTIYPMRKKARMLMIIKQRSQHDQGAINAHAPEA